MNYYNSDRDKRNEDKQKDIVDWVYDEFQKIFEIPCFKKQLKELLNTILLSEDKYLYGLKINIVPIDAPVFCEYFKSKFVNYNKQTERYNGCIKLHDVIEGEKELYVTAEIPNADQNDINLNVTEDTIEITADTPIMNYYKVIDLPSKIRPKKVTYSFKNGILDITMKKRRLINRKLSKNQN